MISYVARNFSSASRLVFLLAALVAAVALALHRQPASRLARPVSNDADDWFISQRAFPRREIPPDVMERAAPAAAALARSRAALAIPRDTWVSIGPQPIVDPVSRATFSGRVTAILAHPTDPNTLYLGANHGGIWKSVDGGQTWSLTTPDLSFPAIRALAMDPANPDILYAATPPGFLSSRLLRSTDAGRTWQEIALKDEQGKAVTVLYKILIDPRKAGSPATTTLYLQRGGWLYRTDDGGKTLRTVLTMPDAGVILNNGPEFLEDVAIDPAHPSSIFALSIPYVCNDPCSNPDPALILYRSFDRGDHWTRQRIISTADVLPDSRILVSPNGADVFVAFQDKAAEKIRVMRSADEGESWSEINTTKPSSFAWPTAFGFSPAGDTMYLGNLSLSRSTDGGETWSDLSAPHADQTVVAFDASGRLLLGNDGGLFRATAQPGGWTSLNQTLPITECYSVAAHPTNGGRVLIGTQDNGTIELAGGSWTRTFGGDGGEVVYDPTGAFYYLETQWDSTTGAYNFVRCADGGACQRRVAGISTSDKAPFIPRFTLDLLNASTLYLTAERLYRTDNAGVTWSSITQSVATNQRCWPNTGAGASCANATYFTAVAVAPSSSQVVYAGTRNGDIWVTTNRGTTWKSVAGAGAAPLPVRSVTEIVVDPDDPRVAYVAFGGYTSSGVGRGHVFGTSDTGATWRDLSGNLPDIHVASLLVDPDAKPRVLYAGTDLGVFRSTDDSGGKWEDYNAGLPALTVTRLAYNRATRTLVAATYGRGVYAISDRFATSGRRSR